VRDTELPVHGFQAGDPEAGGLVVLLGLFSLVALQLFLVRVTGLLAVAMVRLVVEHQDIFHAHEVGHHALEHLAVGFQGLEVRARAAFEQGAPSGRQLDTFAKLQRMVIRNHDLGSFDVVEKVVGNEFAARVIAIGVVRLEYPKAIFNGEARRDDEEAAGEVLAGRSAHGVYGLPGDEHGHDRSLARPGGELKGDTKELRIGIAVRGGEQLEDAFAGS
jgi:hypothetical protein